MKKVFFFLLVLIFTFASCNSKKEIEKTKIGISVPLTGNLAYWGDELRRGMAIYAATENVKDSIDLLFKDNRGNPNEAVTTMKNLIEFNKAQVIISMLVKLGSPQRELAEQKKIPLISTYNSSSYFTKGYAYTYQDFSTHEWQLPALADFAYNYLNKRKGIVFCSTDDFGKDGKKYFELNYEKLGGTLIDVVSFSPGTIDLRNDIIKIMSQKPEFIFVVGQEKELIAATKQIRERDQSVVILGIGSFDSPTVWSSIPIEYQNNIYFVNSFFDKTFNNESMNYYNAYYDLYKQDPSMPSVYGYSICKYVYTILKEAYNKHTSFAAIADTIQISSIRGNLEFNKSREIMSNFGLYQREGNKSILIKKYRSYYNE